MNHLTKGGEPTGTLRGIEEGEAERKTTTISKREMGEIAIDEAEKYFAENLFTEKQREMILCEVLEKIHNRYQTQNQ